MTSTAANRHGNRTRSPARRSSRPRRPWLHRAAGLGLALAALGLPAALPAATFYVTDTADGLDAAPGDGVCETAPGNGVCTLRAAIQETNNLGGADIVVLFGATFTLSEPGQGDDDALSGDLDIRESLTLRGFGIGTTIIDAAGLDRVFDVRAGVTADLSALTITNGAVAPENGGGVRNLGTLLLTDVAVTGNSAKDAAGIDNRGSMTLSGVTLSGNTGTNQGGAVRAEGGANTLDGVTISGNSALDGAGFFIKGAGTSGDFTNVTISGNTAGSKGGGIHTERSINLTNVTITGNTAPLGAGINFGGGPAAATLLNTIVANSITGPDCSDPLLVTSLGYNIDSDGTCGLIGPGDQPSTAPQLGPLQDNGGPSQTHALLLGSPALDRGTNPGCPPTDQRGYTRPRNGVCDIGAYEAVRMYVEKAEVWIPNPATEIGTWVTIDLGGPPFDVPADAVVEVAIRNADPALLPSYPAAGDGAHVGGLRAVGSVLERKIELHQADGGGFTYATMHVQANAASQIQFFAETTDISFVLLGYWGDGVAYEEEYSCLGVDPQGVPCAGALPGTGTWVDQTLAGVGADEVAEVVMTTIANNSSDSGQNRGRWVGARANGSTLERRVLLDNSRRYVLGGFGGGEGAATFFVQADAASTIEIYDDDTASFAPSLTFYVVGSWTTPPGNYQELAESGLGSPTAVYPTWEGRDLGAFGLPPFAVAEMLVGHSDDDDAAVLGLRATGSSLDRTLQPHDAGRGSPAMACCEDDTQLGRMHVATDAASAVQWTSQAALAADDHFFLAGYWFDLVMDGDFSEWDDGLGTSYCVDDQGGPDDWPSPANLDITKFCIASDRTDDVFLLFGFDDVTLSGGNRATACVLVDTDAPPNDNADRLVCATLKGSGATQVDSVELFTCTDGLSDGCSGAVLAKIYDAADYGFSNTETGPFGGQDSYLELRLPYSDLGVSGGAIVFSSMISYPGNSPQNLTAAKDSIFGFGGAQDYDGRVIYDLDGGSGATTPVTLSFFEARGGGMVTFSWETATETSNLGFHLWVLERGELRRLNAELIPSHVVDSLEPQRYELTVRGVRGDQFLLEDVDIFGASRFHGPFELNAAEGRRAGAEQRIGWERISRERQARAAAPGGRERGRDRFGRRSGYAEARLLVESEGIQRVSYEALAAAGVDLAGVPARELALWSRGVPVPLRVVGPDRFGPGSYLEFVGEPLDTLYTRTNVYTLRVGRDLAREVVEDRTPVRPWARVPESYLETARVERNRAYHFAAPGADPWYDTRLLATGGPVAATFELELDGRVEGAGAVHLEVALWGVTDFPEAPDHHVVVEVNGVELADERFDGQVEHPVRFEVPEWVLAPAGNELRVVLPHDTGARFDLVSYDHYRVRYPRRFAARDGRLRFRGAAEAFRVDGLGSPQVEVYRLRAGSVERLSQVQLSGRPGSYSATFAGSKEEAVYYVSTLPALAAPVIERARPPRKLVRGEAELLILAHPDFVEAVEPLAAARRSAGFSVQVIDVEEIYASLSHGIFEPEAIRAFIRLAFAEMGTEYVLLVGGDTYDYHDHLGQGAVSFVPTLYAQTDAIVRYAPADALYADVDLDGLPDLAIGRLPVRTAAELEALIEKTFEYESSAYGGSAVLAADAYDVASGYSFLSASEALRAMLPSGWQVERAYLDELSLGEARDLLIGSINGGVALTSFFGHSGPTVWSFQGLFSSADADALENRGRPTVVTQWGCWNTYFVSPSYDTLGHRLLLSRDRGAAAVLGAATLTEAAAERELGRRLFQRLALGGQTLGRAVLEAKRDLATSQPDRLDVLLGWTLLGDPTLAIQP